MIIHTYCRSKKKKPNAKQRQLQAEWEAIVEKHRINVKIPKDIKAWQELKPQIRKTKHYPSLNTFEGSTAKLNAKIYTGDKVIGIGTLHKSNVVPIFSEEEAKDQASMRR